MGKMLPPVTCADPLKPIEEIVGYGPMLWPDGQFVNASPGTPVRGVLVMWLGRGLVHAGALDHNPSKSLRHAKILVRHQDSRFGGGPLPPASRGLSILVAATPRWGIIIHYIAPGRTRTCNLRFRRPSLCPIALRAPDARRRTSHGGKTFIIRSPSTNATSNHARTSRATVKFSDPWT